MCKFTIAIPVYNGVKSIAGAVYSAISQDYNLNYEVLVVNNNSDDGTDEVLNNFKNKIRIVENAKTVSMYENHNICIEKAKGDYVLFCHADDMLEKNALTILHKEISLHEFPEKFIIWGRSIFRDFGINYQMAGGELNKVLAGTNSVKPFLYGGLTPSGTCYSKKSILSFGGFLNCNHRLAPSDWITMIMLALEGFEFKMIDVLYFQRTLASTLSVGTPRGEIRASLVEAISELYKKLPKNRFDSLIDISQELNIPPLNFYYGCAKNGISRSRINNILIKKLFKHPFLVINGFLKIIFF